jgi:hypothetical protein
MSTATPRPRKRHTANDFTIKKHFRPIHRSGSRGA